MFTATPLGNRIFLFEFSQVSHIEFNEYIESFDTLYGTEKNFRIIFDVSNATMTDCTYLKQQTKYMMDNSENAKKYLDKTAIVVNNDFIVSTINWFFDNIKRPEKPYIMTKSLDDAKEFISK